MKKSALTLIIITLFAFTVVKDSTKKILTSGRWNLEVTQIDGEEELLEDSMKEGWIEFKKDGTFVDYQGGETVTSKWKLNEKDNVIEIMDQGVSTLKQRIIEINKTKLVLEMEVPSGIIDEEGNEIKDSGDPVKVINTYIRK